MRGLLSRPTGDLLILLFAGTICLVLVLAITSVLVVRLAQPDRDLSQAIGGIAGIINTMLGLTAGFIAGRTEVRSRAQANVEQDNK